MMPIRIGLLTIWCRPRRAARQDDGSGPHDRRQTNRAPPVIGIKSPDCEQMTQDSKRNGPE